MDDKKTDSPFAGDNSHVARIANAIGQDIIHGVLAPGEPLKSARQLATAFGVSKSLIPGAMALLEHRNLVVRKPRKGVFVNPERGQQQLLVLYEFNADTTAPWHQILPHIMEEASRLGIGVTTYDLHEFATLSLEQALRFLDGCHILGIIMLASGFLGHEPIVPLLRQCHTPIVLASSQPGDAQKTGFVAIASDARRNWTLALTHLRDQGFRSVLTQAYVSYDGLIRNFSLGQYTALLKGLGLDTNEKWILQTPLYDKQKLEEAFHAIYQLGKDYPRVVMCFSDFSAVHVYQILTDMGFRIPDDIAVMGYCGAEIGRTMPPPLSTIDVGYRKMGIQSVRILLEHPEWFGQVNSQSPPREILIEPELRVRESTRAICASIES